MDKQKILKHVDHTNLNIKATKNEIILAATSASGMCASVCIPPCYVNDVKTAIKKLKLNIPVCTVIGFPNGYMSTAAKVLEVQEALKDGADEIDMVANIGWELEGKFNDILDEITLVRNVCNKFSSLKEKNITLKVIVESSLLNEDTIRMMCTICHFGNADYIKTSTGVNGTASLNDVSIMADEIKKHGYDEENPFYRKLKIKASGGISTFEDAEKFIEAGADRIGASRLLGR